MYSVIHTPVYIIMYTRTYSYPYIYLPVGNSYHGHTCDMGILIHALCLYSRVYTKIYRSISYLNSVNGNYYLYSYIYSYSPIYIMQ